MKSLTQLLFDKAAQVALVARNTPAYAGDARDPNSIAGLGRSPEEGVATHPVSVPANFQGQRSLSGHSPWGHTELATTAGPTRSCYF